MASTMPTRFDAAMFEAAKTAGERSHRSAAQQLAHWARLGQELEAASGVSQRDVNRVLAGQLSYDALGDPEQAVVRTAWREGIDEDVATLDLRATFAREGRTSWSEADPDGNVVQRTAEATPRRTRAAG